MLALGTDLRLGELLGLKWSDIDLKEGDLICKELPKLIGIEKLLNKNLRQKI